MAYVTPSHWTGATAPDRLSQLLAQYPGAELEAYPVSTHVNRPANDDPACAEALK